MGSIRLIATDLDFTLLNEHFVLTETTKEIVSRIFRKRRGVCALQLRPLGEIPQWLREQKNPLGGPSSERGLNRGQPNGRNVGFNTLPSERAKSCDEGGIDESALELSDRRAVATVTWLFWMIGTN